MGLGPNGSGRWDIVLEFIVDRSSQDEGEGPDVCQASVSCRFESEDRDLGVSLVGCCWCRKTDRY